METLQFNGKLKRYFQAPLYMIFVFLAGDIGLLFYNIRIGAVTGVFVLLYAAIVLVLYRVIMVRLNEEIIHFATHYGTVQKELLDKFQIPYALLDAGGKILWMNEEFAGVSGKDKHYQKSISTVFREITKESLAKVQQDSFNVQMELNDRVYQASMQKLYFTEMGEGSQILTTLDKENTLIALLLFDETELVKARRENSDQQMVTALSLYRQLRRGFRFRGGGQTVFCDGHD